MGEIKLVCRSGCLNDRRLLIEITKEVGQRTIDLHVYVDDRVDLNGIEFDMQAGSAGEGGQGKPEKMSSMHEREIEALTTQPCGCFSPTQLVHPREGSACFSSRYKQS